MDKLVCFRADAVAHIPYAAQHFHIWKVLWLLPPWGCSRASF